jgi:UDP-N-acetylmuramoylalanine--D-glutamate ligase
MQFPSVLPLSQKACSMRLRDLDGRNVAICGAGREGGAALRAIRKTSTKANVRVFDENATAGATLEDIEVERFSAEKLDKADVIIRSPGISKYRPEFQGRDNITTATNLWFAEPHAPVLAVTGTKGKSTSSSLIAHLLNALGVNARLAGNIGQNPLDLLGEPEPDWWVLELSSYQTSDLVGHPQIAVMTSFSPEHLDWHQGVENYLRDKTRLLDLADQQVINPVDDVTRELLQRFPDAVVPDENEALPPSNLRGPHNERLIRLALTVVRTMDFDLDAHAATVREALMTFQPLPHRLEPVGEINGVLYVNDSLSTVPTATQAAINAFVDRPKTVLVGGHDRGISFEEFGAFVRAQTDVNIITLPDCGDRIAAAIDRPDVVTHANSLEEAVAIAMEKTPSGGVVLLSPGAASFGHFKDYADRGQQFADLVRKHRATT